MMKVKIFCSINRGKHVYSLDENSSIMDEDSNDVQPDQAEEDEEENEEEEEE